MRKVQIYLSEEQYRILKQRAGEDKSIAGVVRELIDSSETPQDPRKDPFYLHLTKPETGSGKPHSAEEAKRDLYRVPR